MQLRRRFVGFSKSSVDDEHLLLCLRCRIRRGEARGRFQSQRLRAFLSGGMLPWLAFAEAVGRSPYVVLDYRNLVKKLVFPLDTLPVNLVISGAVTETVGLVIFL